MHTCGYTCIFYAYMRNGNGDYFTVCTRIVIYLFISYRTQSLNFSNNIFIALAKLNETKLCMCIYLKVYVNVCMYAIMYE